MDVLVKNAAIVCEARKFDLKEWAKRAGLSYRVLAYYMRKERAPALDTLDDLAAAAGLTLPELLADGLTVDFVRSRALNTLIDTFTDASPKARDYAQEILSRDTTVPKQA